ncbi:MAG: alpha/beta fold hydrolase [Elusimicrobia bacterium]|nr:alpha/beta fold hydrolase [Elusimicrobiota bacterium]
MIWLSLAVLGLLALLGACWWGSSVIFDPPKMLDHTIWPDRYQLGYETFRVRTSDGLELVGWLIAAAEPTDRTLLLLHGWGDNKGDLLTHTHYLSKRFNLVYLDHRNHGESAGVLSTIGCLESRDVEAALEHLKRERPRWRERLGVFGLSMGAAIAVWAAARHPELRCVAVEAPFPSFNQVARRWARNAFRLPYFPFVWLTLRIVRFRLGEDPEPYSPAYHVARVAPRPILFIAGADDRLMPVADVREVYEKAGEPKELWVIDNARHGKCEETAGEGYHRRLLEFYDAHL